MSVLAKCLVDISKTVGGDSFPVNLYFFNKNWEHCKLATVSIFKISLIDPPMDAIDGGIEILGLFEFFKKIPTGGGGGLP